MHFCAYMERPAEKGLSRTERHVGVGRAERVAIEHGPLPALRPEDPSLDCDCACALGKVQRKKVRVATEHLSRSVLPVSELCSHESEQMWTSCSGSCGDPGSWFSALGGELFTFFCFPLRLCVARTCTCCVHLNVVTRHLGFAFVL